MLDFCSVASAAFVLTARSAVFDVANVSTSGASTRPPSLGGNTMGTDRECRHRNDPGAVGSRFHDDAPPVASSPGKSGCVDHGMWAPGGRHGRSSAATALPTAGGRTLSESSSRQDACGPTSPLTTHDAQPGRGHHREAPEDHRRQYSVLRGPHEEPCRLQLGPAADRSGGQELVLGARNDPGKPDDPSLSASSCRCRPGHPVSN